MQGAIVECEAPFRGRLRVEVGGEDRPLPVWADWLMSLGEWMRLQVSRQGMRVTVVRLPTRRLASAFVALGALCTAARIHDESLDWEALLKLPEGTTVYWREATGVKPKRYAGRTLGVRTMHGADFLAISLIDSRGKEKGATFYLPRTTALSHGVTLGTISARADDRLTTAALFMRALISDASPAWFRSPMPDSTLVTERTSFEQDLDGIGLQASSVSSASLLQVLALTDIQNREHGKLLLVSPRSDKFLDAPSGVTILDGPAALSKLALVQARSVIVLLSQAEYDEEVVHQLSQFLSYSIDDGIYPWAAGAEVGNVPLSVEAFSFGLPVQPAGVTDAS